MDLMKGDKVVYVYGNILICEKVKGVKEIGDTTFIQLANSGWYDSKIFHKVPKDFEEGNYTKVN